MKRKLIALGLASAMALTAVGCNSKTETNTQSSSGGETATTAPSQTQAPQSEEPGSSGEKDYSVEINATMARRGDVRDVKEELYLPFLKENYNLNLEVIDIPSSDFLTRMNLLYASGEQPDFTSSQRPEFMLNEWIEAEYLRGFTLSDLQEKLPNYIASYTGEAWENVWSNISHSDDKAYYMPGRRAAAMNMAWMYRDDIFDKHGLEVPVTTDELLENLKTIRDEEGIIPYVAANTDPLWAFTGFLQCFGIPELAPRDLSYVNPVTGDFVPYAFVEDNYRDHVKYMSTLYDEGIIWQEFSTGTTEQVNKLKTQGHGVLLWGYPDKVETEYNKLSKNENPDASWDWSRNMITYGENEPFYFKRDPYFAADGVAFSADSSDELVERVLDLVNWFYSEEGQILHTYGWEGITYEKDGDNYLFMDHMKSPLDSEGNTIANYGIVGLGVQHPNLNDYYRPYITELQDNFIGRDNYYFHVAPVLKFTDEESTILADLQVNMNQARDEYYVKFIMGHLDVNDDAEWDKHLETMERYGLSTVQEIRTNAYNRNN